MMGNNMQRVESRADAKPTLAAAPAAKKISFGVETFCDVKNWGIESLLESPDISDLQIMQKEYEEAENLLFGDALPEQQSGLTDPKESERRGNLFEAGSGGGLDSLESAPINKYLTSIFEMSKESRYGHKNGKPQILKKYNTYADRNADIFLPFESEDLFFKNGPHLDCITFDKMRLSEGGNNSQASGPGPQLKGTEREAETEQEDMRTVQYRDITNTSSTDSSAQGGGYQGIRKAKTDIHNYETNRKRQDQLLNIYRSFNTPTPDMKCDFQDSLFGFSMNAHSAFGSDSLTGTATFGDRTKSPLFHPLSFGSADPMADTLISGLDRDKEATAESLRAGESLKNEWTLDCPQQLKEEMNAAEYNLYKNLMNYLDNQDTKEAPAGLVPSILVDPDFDPSSGKDDLIDLQNTVLYEASEPTNLDAFHDDGFINANGPNTRLGEKATPKYFDGTKGAGVAPTLPGPLGSMDYRQSEQLASEYFPMKGSPEVKHPYLGTARNRCGAAVVDPRDSAADPTNSRSKASSILKNCIVSLIQNGEDDITLYESLVNAISEHHRLKNTLTPKYGKPATNDKSATNLKSVEAPASPLGPAVKRPNCPVSGGGMCKNSEEADMSTRTYVQADAMRLRLPRCDPMDRYLPLNEDRTSRKESLSKCANDRMDYFKSGVSSEAPTMDQANGSKPPVVNVLFDEYYSKFLPKREASTSKSGVQEGAKYARDQESKGYDQFAYGRKKSDTERRGTTFGRKKDSNIEDILFSNIRNKKDIGYPSGMVDVNRKTEETSMYSQDRFVNGQFVPRKRSGGSTNQLNFSAGTRGIAEIRSRNRNLGSFYSPDVNRMSAMHNLHMPKGGAEGLAGMGEIRPHMAGTYDKVDAYRDSKMRSRTPGYVPKPWMNESLQKGLLAFNGRDSGIHPTCSMNRGQYRSDLVRGQTFSKYKSLDSENVRYTPEQLKSIITKEDERNMDLLLQSLYDDRILPLEFNLNGRLEEMKILSFLKNNWLVAYGLFPDKYTIKKTKDLSDNLIFFRNRKVGEDYFVYLNNLEDKYSKDMWAQFEQYLKTIAQSDDPSAYEFAGGRYGMAKELKRRNLPFFEGLYLGHICHIIHLSTSKKLIAYEQKLLKPISKCHKFMNAKLGILNTNESDSNTYIASIEELRFYMNELLKYYRGGFNISTLKKKLKTRFNKQISESIFHCIKLIDVLQLKELSDICIIDKEMKYVRSAKKQ